MSMKIVQLHLFQLVICASEEHTLEQVIEFAEQEEPCGTEAGWQHDTNYEFEGKHSPFGPCEHGNQHWVLCA